MTLLLQALRVKALTLFTTLWVVQYSKPHFQLYDQSPKHLHQVLLQAEQPYNQRHQHHPEPVQSSDDIIAASPEGQGFNIVYDTVGGPVLEASLSMTTHYLKDITMMRTAIAC
jgi:hypothetical protein